MKATPDLDPMQIRNLFSAPHATLFRALIAEPAEADALVRDSFPASLGYLLRARTARPCSVDLRGGYLQAKFLDGVLEFGGSRGRPDLVVLVRHVRSADLVAVDDLVGPVVAIRERYEDTEPEVFLLVIHSGPEAWRVPGAEQWDNRGVSVLQESPLGIYFLRRTVAEVRYEALSRSPAVRGVLGALHCARLDPPPMGTLAAVFRDLAAIRERTPLWGMAYVYGLLAVELEAEEYRALIREADPMAADADMAALSQQLTDVCSLQHCAGFELDIHGELLVRELEKKFGPVPDNVTTRVLEASGREVDAWGEAIFNARSLDDLFGNMYSN